MVTYVIGDIQGCFDPFIRLLKKINFNSNQDCLWFTGDLVNRGPASLEVLRFVKSLKYSQVVLGNHDLHLLSVMYGKSSLLRQDTLDAILNAPDKKELANWLRHRPLLHHDSIFDFILVHAGLSPQWDFDKALQCAHELEVVLQSNYYSEFFEHMYGDFPSRWSDNLKGWDRLRVITNCFTRLRFCDADGNLDLNTKGTTPMKKYFPWFEVPNRRSKGLKIIFGHWAALKGKTNDSNIIALDTG
ncbi:MAG: symmetrical bis(5'-nucleosyl)-tetraphosphatase, partial [Rickettsiella sp.]|nr:symmetrical bis(5'-nucleosyl)-tetraphosphatase [Rickettsiella sp.]